MAGLVRRSLVDAVGGLAAHQLGASMLLWNQTEADVFLVCVVGGWTWLAGLHLLNRRPSLFSSLVPVLFLFLVTCWFGRDAELRGMAQMHAGLMVVVLVLLGSLWRWTRFHWLGFGCGLGYAVLLVLDRAAGVVRPMALLMVVGGFSLLLVGALVSWHKPALLVSLGRDIGRAVLSTKSRRVVFATSVASA